MRLLCKICGFAAILVGMFALVSWLVPATWPTLNPWAFLFLVLSLILGARIHIMESEKQDLYQQLDSFRNHDALTGLFNRRFFEEYMARKDEEPEGTISIITADVNGLKVVNDAFGIDAGDYLLKRFAEILHDECGRHQIAARLGGDDFAVALSDTSFVQAEEMVKRIIRRCEAVFINGLSISVSFGCAERRSSDEKLGSLLKSAKTAMNRHKLAEVYSTRGKTIQTIINTLHEKNKREEQHSQRVAILGVALGKALGLDELQQRELRTMGLLHDVGKIGIDENILNNTGSLSLKEFEEIKRHPEIGYRILSSVKELAEMAEYVLAHHERWDGSGYPKGLQGNEIPYMSRIIGVVDAYDAMTTDRSYRKAMSDASAVKELKKFAGLQFDPAIVQVFISRSDIRFCDKESKGVAGTA